STPINYQTNEANQYAVITNQDNVPPDENLTYDEDGNLTSSSNGKQYAYNAENRLILIAPQYPEDDNTRVEFAYDYMGRRIQKKVFTLNAGTWENASETLFVYDNWNLIKEITIPYSSDTTNQYYIRGQDLSQSIHKAGGVNGLLAAIKQETLDPTGDFDLDLHVDGSHSTPLMQKVNYFIKIARYLFRILINKLHNLILWHCYITEITILLPGNY
ncbi:MAG: hypothetical protein K8S13_14180, partial [Desulfobacula sp.]|nr:hypothetical protein [Desulfobacula sp.]